MSKSTRTSIYITWQPVQATSVPVLGYKVYLS